ncbi:hypothetical protein JR316_0000980 [Psilocybe cubensis]|uniref:Uncharacterized protein n=2 Tax=Psilocybe cubensis TaxID=181762 RepID=A0ACB8HGU9_PSICU|nr:hypothetical protein JR316_0000980 [Psilocybe cubensis]KAH9486914.1 hypothetical protein JR316_0000980 [Psilocybe cubensis]
MPKSNTNDSPPRSTANPKPPSEVSTRMTDVALRKKKNADAQAAFRARRANYIATLEETVTNLESVVLQVQEASRDLQNLNAELRQENIRLRVESREREKFWRALFQTRKSGRVDDLPALPSLSSPFLAQAQLSDLSAHPPGPAPVVVHTQYGGGQITYRGESDASQGHYSSPASGNGANFNNQSPTIPFPNTTEMAADGSSASHLNARGTKYPPAHPYPLSRDARWQASPPIVPGGESGTPPHSQSPVYVHSPTLTATSDMITYPGRFNGDEQKGALNSVLENAPYVFPNGDRFHQSVGDTLPNSRSLSPTASTPSSSTSIPMTSSFPFSFHEQPSGQDRTGFDYRRHSLPHCPEVTLHGGTADISLTGQTSDPVRYRTSRRPETTAEYPPIIPANDNELDLPSSDGDIPFTNEHLRTRRNTAHSHPQPEPSSPGPTPISCTVAVIKAHAFGALRRTRARGKKSSQGAAKVAMDVLEARGISVPTGSKRPRLEEDDFDVETP